MYGETESNSISGVERISIIEYLRSFLGELSDLERCKVNLKTEAGALRIKGLMNIPENTIFKSMNDLRSGQPYWNEQKVDYVPSNLGRARGFTFYFICNSCQKRVKCLYFLSSLEAPLCRVCSRLQYNQPRRKERMLSHLIRKNYLSTESKYMIMKKLGINKDDIDNYLSDFDETKKHGII